MKVPPTWMVLAALAANGIDPGLSRLPRCLEPEPKTPADIERMEAARQKRLRRAAKRRTP